MDTDGIEWFACDPYPTWYRWDDGELYEATGPRVDLIDSNRRKSCRAGAKAPWADGLDDWMKGNDMVTGVESTPGGVVECEAQGELISVEDVDDTARFIPHSAWSLFGDSIPKENS